MVVQRLGVLCRQRSAPDRYFVEDLSYSQAVARVGYVKGVGVVTREAPRMNLVGDPFYTDGLRAVLFFEPRPYTLSDIEQLSWGNPSSYFKLIQQE